MPSFNESLLYLSVFKKSLKKIQFSLKSERIMGTLHIDLCTFMIISCRILPKIRNISKQILEEKIKINMFNNIFLKIVPFIR